MPRLSVFIITLNEEKNIRRCLESVRWADEIVLLDSGSTDRTVEIAKRYTDKVHVRAFTDYADQKNSAMSKAAGDWVLSLDADEEPTPELCAEIRETLERDPRVDGYRIRRRSSIFGRWFSFTGTQDDRPLRLFRRGKARFSQPVHERVELDGPAGELKHPMRHFTYCSVSDYMRRFNRYTSMEAQYLSRDGRTVGPWGASLQSAGMFFRLYIWKQGFRDGRQGFLFSVLSAFYVFMKHAKAWEAAEKP